MEWPLAIVLSKTALVWEELMAAQPERVMQGELWVHQVKVFQLLIAILDWEH